MLGTAAYFSPEQALGKPATAASDRYSLAVVAYELLTGARPFPAGTPAAQARARVDGDPPRPTAVAPGLPTEVDDVLARGLAREPDDRPATGAELVAALHGALGPTASTGAAVPVAVPATEVVRQRQPRPAREATPPVPAQAPAGEPARARAAAPPREPAPPPAAPAGDPGRRRGRTGALAALAALVLIAGAAIAAALGGGGDDPKPQASVSKPTTTAAKKHRRTTSTAAQPAAAATTTAAPAATGAPADAAGIQADAHRKLQAGDYGGAASKLQGLVNRCPVAVTDPCAYAWFDLGYALRRAGDPSAAVPVLEHRLQNPDQRGTVQAELDAARAEAQGGTAPPGHGKKDKRPKD